MSQLLPALRNSKSIEMPVSCFARSPERKPGARGSRLAKTFLSVRISWQFAYRRKHRGPVEIVQVLRRINSSAVLTWNRRRKSGHDRNANARNANARGSVYQYDSLFVCRRGAECKFRTSWNADGCRGYGIYAVDEISQIQPEKSAMV